MSLRAPTLQWVEEDSGVLRPKVFKGDNPYVFTDRRLLLWQGLDLVRERGVLFAECVPHPNRDHHSEQMGAADHAKACRALDLTPAGRRATELLLDFLTPDQRRDAQLKRYFDVGFVNPYRIEDDLLREKRSLTLNAAIFRFHRGFPNGNIHLLEGDRIEYTFCLHPISPYPTDDIVLAQYLMLLDDPDEFLRQANTTSYEGRRIRRFEGLFEEPEPQPPRLILP